MSQLYIALFGLASGIVIYTSLRRKVSIKSTKLNKAKLSVDQKTIDNQVIEEIKSIQVLEEAITLAMEDGRLSKGEEIILREKAVLVGKDPDELIQQLREDLFGLEDQENEEVDPDFNPGLTFERYVVQKFNPGFFCLDYWAGDRFIADRYTSTVLKPDIQVTINTAEGRYPLAVECKWRSKQKGDYIWFAEDKQLKEYQRFAKDTGKPTFIILGLGGKPNEPEEVYLIPVNAFNFGTQHRASLIHYRKPHPDLGFFFDVESGGLM